MYQIGDLIRVARRNYEGPRPFVIVNPLQGKHIPVSSQKALGMMHSLGSAVKKSFPDEKIFCVGFAETATAIGVTVAETLDAPYIHTTRENLVGTNDYFFFQETHSRWTEQKLCAENWNLFCEGRDRIVFVEDEISTGNTIRNLVSMLHKKGVVKDSTRFAVACLINTLDDKNVRLFKEVSIDTVCLLKVSHASFGEDMLRIQPEPGLIHEASTGHAEVRNITIAVNGKIDPCRGITINTYLASCDRLAEEVISKIAAYINDRSNMRLSNVLFLGTEECMFPALYTASLFETRHPEVAVWSHATTRTPIMPSSMPEYPIQSAWKLRSVYDGNRETFVYNLRPYDLAIIITETELKKTAMISGMSDLFAAFAASGTEDIIAIHWQNDMRRG